MCLRQSCTRCHIFSGRIAASGLLLLSDEDVICWLQRWEHEAPAVSLSRARDVIDQAQATSRYDGELASSADKDPSLKTYSLEAPHLLQSKGASQFRLNGNKKFCHRYCEIDQMLRAVRTTRGSAWTCVYSRDGPTCVHSYTRSVNGF